MHSFIVIFLALVAHVAQADDNPSASSPILLSRVSPFEPWSGYFKGEENPGNQQAIDYCHQLGGSPEGKGWLVNQAYCWRQDPNIKSFKAGCAAKAQLLQTSRDTELKCGDGLMCTEFHDRTQTGQDATDVVCAPRAYFRKIYVSGGNTICSALYTNDRKDHKALNISLLTNVLDQAGMNRIPPRNIFYQLNYHEVGIQRTYDPIVESGIITVPWNTSARACITADYLSTDSVYVNLVGLAVLG